MHAALILNNTITGTYKKTDIYFGLKTKLKQN